MHLNLDKAAATALIAILAMAVTVTARADTLTEGYERAKAQALSPLQSQFDLLVASHSNESGIVDLLARIKVVDSLVAIMLEALEASKDSSLEQLLKDAAPSRASSDRKGSAVLSAAEIFVEYQLPLENTIAQPRLADGEKELLRQYYTACVRAAQQHVASRAQQVAPISRLTETDMVELCCVVPMLHVPDSAWSKQEIETLPIWMRKPASLEIMERFALRIRRPATAYAVAQYRASLAESSAPAPPKYREYLNATARQFIKQREYQIGIFCLQESIRLSEESQSGAVADAARLDLAEIYSDTGHPQLAADALVPVLASDLPAESYGKAATMRLKYLYEAQKFDQLVQEFGKYKQDQRCSSYQPQLMYVAWVALRRDNRGQQADEVQKDFLKRYPEHPLAADVHFARAMSALAESDYKEASRLLELVEYKFPESRLLPRVKEIRQRLAQVSADSTVKAK